MKIFWLLAQEQFQPETMVEHGAAAEAAGFDGLAVSDHFHPFVDDHGAGGFAWSVLGALAQATARLELMTAVVTPLWRYHPAVVAQAAATVDRLSGGRFSLGVGTGRNEGALGFPYPPYAERSERMAEALKVMQRLLSGERLDFDGRFYQTREARLYSPPLKHVPVYMAAGGPKSARLAAQQSDGVVVSVKGVDDAAEQVVQPARAAAKGRRLVVVASRWSVRARNDDEAWAALAPLRGLRAPDRDRETDPAELRRAADELPRAQVLGAYPRVQDAADYVRVYGAVVERLRPDVLVIQTTSTDQRETIAMVGREVVPELKRLGGKEAAG